jgi:hypothetical protein
VAASKVGLRNAVLSALFTTKVEKIFKLLSMVFPFDKIIIVFKIFYLILIFLVGVQDP